MGRGTPDEIDGRKIVTIYQRGFPIETPDDEVLELTRESALADNPGTEVMRSEITHSPELDANNEVLGTVYLADIVVPEPEPEPEPETDTTNE